MFSFSHALIENLKLIIQEKTVINANFSRLCLSSQFTYLENCDSKKANNYPKVHSNQFSTGRSSRELGAADSSARSREEAGRSENDTCHPSWEKQRRISAQGHYDSVVKFICEIAAPKDDVSRFPRFSEYEVHIPYISHISTSWEGSTGFVCSPLPPREV